MGVCATGGRRARKGSSVSTDLTVGGKLGEKVSRKEREEHSSQPITGEFRKERGIGRERPEG